MATLIRLAEAWWPLYAVHMSELSLFVLLVWAVDRFAGLDTRLRYCLWLLALVKAFVPPFYALPLPAFLTATPVPMTASFAGPESLPDLPGAMSGFVAHSVPWAVWVFCLWALSVLIFVGGTVLRNARFQRSLAVASPVALPGEVAGLNGVGLLRVYAKVNLRSPLLVGVMRPRLYLPAHWRAWTPTQLRGVVAHELAHFHNRDIWALVFQALATAFFGLNPLVWLVNRRLSHLRELRCDEVALSLSGVSPVAYGKLLFDFLDDRSQPVLTAMHFNEQGTPLKKRFEHVLNFKGDDITRSKWRRVVPLLIGLAIVPFSIRETYSQTENATAVNGVQTVPDNMREAKAKLIHAVAPKYPETLRSLGASGYVLMALTVEPDGHVDGVKMLEGDSRFENPARTALEQFQFEPPSDGSPWKISQAIFFHLDTSDQSLPDPVVKKSVLGPIVVITAANKKSAQIWINSKGQLLLNEEMAISLSDLNTQLEWLKHAKKIQALEVKIDTDAPNNVVQQVVQSAKNKGLFVNVQGPAGESGNAEMSQQPSGSFFTQGSGVAAHRFFSGKHFAPAADGTMQFYKVEVKPKPLQTATPIYPDEARKKGLSGKVFVKLKVNVDGSVSDVQVLKGKKVFHQAAIDAVSQFRFKPAEHNGQPIAVWMTMPVTFSLSYGTTPNSGTAEGSGEMVQKPSASLFNLLPNHPNPFNPDTIIPYDLGEQTFVKLEIYSETGQVIRTLVSQSQAAGHYDAKWNGKDDSGNPVASGIYYYHLTTDHFSSVKKMMLIK